MEQYEPWEIERWMRKARSKSKLGFIIIKLFYFLQDFIIFYILAVSISVLSYTFVRAINS